MRLCRNILPKRKQCVKFRNVWAVFSNGQNSLKNKILLFDFHGINTKPKNALLCNPVERPSDCRVRWIKQQTKQEIYRKIGRLLIEQSCRFC